MAPEMRMAMLLTLFDCSRLMVLITLMRPQMVTAMRRN